MIPDIVAGWMRVAAVGSVSFVSATGANYVASGASINSPSTPAAIESGDGVFAIVFGRSALTPPAGWTLVASHTWTAAVANTIYVYRKDSVTVADSSTAFTWSQAAAGRMGLAYLVCRSTSGVISVGESAGVTTSSPSTANHSVTAPVLTATQDGELFLMAAGVEQANTDGASNTWTSPSSADLRTIATQADNRLAAATQARSSRQSNGSPWTFTTGVGANDFGALTIRLSPG